MQFIIFFIIIAALFYSGFGPLLMGERRNLQQETPSIIQESVPQKQSAKKQTSVKYIGTATIVMPEQPVSLIDTYITAGPKEGSVIEDTNKVVFEFEAIISPKETEGRISFETKIEGFDDDWKKTYSKKRTINLPPGPQEYIFLVRAKIKDSVDPTPAKRTFKINTSPYFGKVKISRAITQTSSRPSLITLNTYLKEEVSITGWQIRGKAGSFVIPQGIEKYHPGYNPVPKESIFVKKGDRVYLSGSLNPLGRGRNFRPNKCFGYLAEYRDFPISFPINCPKPTREEISHLNPCCQEFILRMRTCEIPDYSSNLKISTDSECVSYLSENFNYTSCFMDHSRDEDFLGRDWHIYMNSNILASNDCDILYLRDQNGLVVDKYSYGRPVCK